MSLILIGIDLPKNKQTTIIEIHPSGSCSVMRTENGECYELEIVSDAEAIQIPTPHGRLIDGDELRKSHCVECLYYPNECKGDDCDSDSVYHIDYIAKTILEAED